MPVLRPLTNIKSWGPTKIVVSVQGGKGQSIIGELPYILIPWGPKSVALTSNVRARGIHVIGDLPFILIPWNNQTIAQELGSIYGIFTCSSLFSCGFEGIAQANRFQSDTHFLVEFIGEPHINFRSDLQVSAQFESEMGIEESFASSCISSISFESAAVTYPRFRCDTKIGFEIFVRFGQSPDCYYDNAQIIASPIRNYVF